MTHGAVESAVARSRRHDPDRRLAPVWGAAFATVDRCPVNTVTQAAHQLSKALRDDLGTPSPLLGTGRFDQQAETLAGWLRNLIAPDREVTQIMRIAWSTSTRPRSPQAQAAREAELRAWWKPLVTLTAEEIAAEVEVPLELAQLLATVVAKPAVQEFLYAEPVPTRTHG